MTHGDYWDCACPSGPYIHKKSESRSCSKCGALEEDYPDSMANEINSENLVAYKNGHLKG